MEEPTSDDTFVERDGVRIGYSVTGTRGPTMLLFTSWAIVHARQWKAQVPYLSRHCRVVLMEGRGNGRADRPEGAAAYTDRHYVEDALAVLDAVGAERAILMGLSMGARHALQMAAWHPDRAAGVVAIGTALPWPLPPGFEDERESYEGWEKANQHYWLADYPGWVEFFMSQVFTEPHSTKQREDGLAWGLGTDVHTLLATVPGIADATDEDAREICESITCPVLVLHGDQDGIVPHEIGAAVARRTGGRLITIEGGGHAPTLRDPVVVNRLVRDFARSLGAGTAAPRTWTRSRDRRKRVLYVCSPIGLGHVRRDLAIVEELRKRDPDLQVDWLTQHPVTQVLEDRGENVHPASRWLRSESGHFEAVAGEHDLNAFHAVRSMDEILVANFMVFHDLIEEDDYDLWVVDEGWDVDHFLFDNPELKRTAYAWFTDFVGWLPMPDGGPEEAALTADWNAEHVEQMTRHAGLRDRSLFVGNPGDLVNDSLGPGLPSVREWASERYDFTGYITGAGPRLDRDQARSELGYRPDERVCVVTVGGSGVGTHLLRRAAEAFPLARRQVPGLRMVLVTGPRIDPSAVSVPPGVEVLGYVPDLQRHLTACDLAVVQGGLTTTMELVAARRPFLYLPLAHHFEQQVHVPQRLNQYAAGRRLEYAETGPEELAAAIVEEIGGHGAYHPVETDGAARAADLLDELL